MINARYGKSIENHQRHLAVFAVDHLVRRADGDRRRIGVGAVAAIALSKVSRDDRGVSSVLLYLFAGDLRLRFGRDGASSHRQGQDVRTLRAIAHSRAVVFVCGMSAATYRQSAHRQTSSCGKGHSSGGSLRRSSGRSLASQSGRIRAGNKNGVLLFLCSKVKENAAFTKRFSLKRNPLTVFAS